MSSVINIQDPAPIPGGELMDTSEPPDFDLGTVS